MDVEVEEPVSGQHIHLVWMLLFLIEYSDGEMLAGMCGVSSKTFQYWVDVFIDHASNLNLLSTLHGGLFFCLFH